MRCSLLSLLLFVASVHGAANIDTGFQQDGKTTYCQGVRGATANPLEFLELEAHNAGRCPIDVLVATTATTVGTAASAPPMEVRWAASVRSGGNVANNIFPRAVDAATKKPQNVIASILRACKAGTNCAPGAVVTPQLAGAASDETGAFDAQGRKAFPLYKFQFKEPGDYVIVGIVTLPGDAALNVSATQFMAFQKITVVDGVGPATVKPPTNSNTTSKEVGGEGGKTTNLNFNTTLTKPITTTAPPATTVAPGATVGTRNPSGVDAEFSGSTKTSNSGSGSGGSSSLLLILVVGVVACVVVLVIAYVVVHRMKQKSLKKTDKGKPLNPRYGADAAGVFRLSHLPGEKEMMPSLSMGSSSFSSSDPRGTSRKQSSASKAHTSSSSQRSLAPPRYTTASSISSTDSGPFTVSSRQPASSNEFPSFENAALAASGKEFKHQRRQPHAAGAGAAGGRVSVASSVLSDFSDLHDSGERFPVTQSRASAATSYGGYDDDNNNNSNSLMSSRLFSEVSVAMPRDTSDYGASFETRESEFSMDERRSTELGALSECGSSVTVGEYFV